MTPETISVECRPENLVPARHLHLVDSLCPVAVELGRTFLLWVPRGASAETCVEVLQHQVGEHATIEDRNGGVWLKIACGSVRIPCLQPSPFEDACQRIGAFIRAERRKAAMTQEGLAALAGLSSEFLGRVERGAQAISLKNLVRIGEVLQVEFFK